MTTVTVLTGLERRRRWSASEKARIVEESTAPGAVVTTVAQQHDVHPNLVHQWRRQAKAAACSARPAFLPVAVTEAGRVAPPARGTIEIDLSGGVRLRVDAAVDEAALGRVLRAVGR